MVIINVLVHNSSTLHPTQLIIVQLDDDCMLLQHDIGDKQWDELMQVCSMSFFA